MLRHSPWGKQKSPSRHSFTSRVRERWGLGRSNSARKPHPLPVSPASTSPTGFAQEPRPYSQALPSLSPPSLPSAHLRRAQADPRERGSPARSCSGRSRRCWYSGRGGRRRHPNCTRPHLWERGFQKGSGLGTLEGSPWGRGIWRNWWVVSRVGYEVKAPWQKWVGETKIP